MFQNVNPSKPDSITPAVSPSQETETVPKPDGDRGDIDTTSQSKSVQSL